MSLSVIFNGIELNNLIDVEYGLNLTDGADWQPELRTISGGNGSDFLKTSYGSKNITMPFRIKNEINSKFDKLQRTLKVSSPQRLSFGNLKNRYFVAIPSSKIDLIVEKNGFIARGTITWLVPDGVSHSTDTKIVTASVVDGILTANVNNNGSDDIWPVYRIKNSTENGWNGIVHAGGVLEIGNKEEDDGENYQKAETLINTSTFDGAQWQDWSGVYPVDWNFDLSGSLSVSGDTGLVLSSIGNNTNMFNGGSKVCTLPPDSEGNLGSANLYCWWDSFFWAGKMGQTAMQDVVFWSGNTPIARWYIFKGDKNGNSALARAFVGDGKGGMTQLSNYVLNFQASNLDRDNPFNLASGGMDFMKEGDKFRFHCWGRYPEIVVPALKDTKITKISIAIANYDKRTGDKYVTFNALQKMIVQSSKVTKWRNVPNRYPAGTEIVVDTESDKVFVNGLPANNDLVNGSEFAPLKTGENKVEFYKSDWSQGTSEITVEYKERWL